MSSLFSPSRADSRLLKRIVPPALRCFVSTAKHAQQQELFFSPDSLPAQLVAARIPSSSGVPVMGEDSAMSAAAAAGGGTPPDSRKRAKADLEAGELARVAEIVMVLSAMGQMRGGRDPTPPEKSLMAEAREKLARVCESMEPHRRKDLFTKEMAMAVVVDHGLNPPKDNIPRPPKSSIAEKVTNTKKKMEETKELVVQSSPHQSQLLHVSFGVKAEGRSPLSHGAQRFVPDKASTTPPGGLQAASSGAPLPTFSSGTSLLKQSQVNEVQRCTSPLKPLASPSASCSSVRLPEKTVVAPVQVTPTTSASSFQANKVQHTAVKVDCAHGITVFQSSAPFIREQDPNTYAIQTIQGNHHFVQQVPHVVNLHESSVFNSHNEISKMVQRILPPKAFDQPNWTPPSTDYINKPLHCMACNNIINDVESLLVCDACEKGVHMKCLLAYQRIIPKAEWHCSNCLASTHGKPLPPKYGRVTRSTAPSRSTSSPGTIQTSLEKKTGNADVKLSSHQKIISNLKPDILTPSHASMGHSHTESITINNMTNILAKQESVLSVTSRNSDVHKEAPPDHSDERTDSATLPSSLLDSNQHKLNTGMLPCHMQQQTPECSLETKAHSMPVGPQKSGFSIDINPASQELNDSQIINKVEVPTDSNMSIKHTDNELNDPSNVKATSVPSGDCDTTGENMSVSQETPSETMNVSQKTTSETLHRHCSGSSSNLRTVEWIGDAVRAVEGKSYYGSCCINGFTYKLEDHVFVSSNNGKPSKLKALWEDQASGTKWAMGHDFYYPNDLPEIIPRPAIPCNDEVYGSNNASTILAESISGPCQVLPPEEFEKVRADRGHPSEGSIGLNPIFICRWCYDESNGVFQCTSR